VLKKKKKKKFATSSSIFAITPRQSSNPHCQEGLTNQIPHSLGTESSDVARVCLGGGGLKLIGALL